MSTHCKGESKQELGGNQLFEFRTLCSLSCTCMAQHAARCESDSSTKRIVNDPLQSSFGGSSSRTALSGVIEPTAAQPSLHA